MHTGLFLFGDSQVLDSTETTIIYYILLLYCVFVFVSVFVNGQMLLCELVCGKQTLI